MAHPDPPPAVERMVRVVSCRDRVHAQLVRGALEAHGLRARVMTDDVGGVHPQLAMLLDGAVRVVVPDHELETARAVLAELDAGVHALPSAGEHERIEVVDHGAGLAIGTVALIGMLLVWRAVTMVWPGLG